MKKKINFLKEFSFGKRVFVSFLFTVFFIISSAQSLGDFRSRDYSLDGPLSTGLWSENTTWERFNGTAYVSAISGQIPGKAGNLNTNVTIRCFGGDVAVKIDKGTYQIGTNLLIEGSLRIINNNGTVDLTGAPKNVDIDGGQILWEGNGNLALPAESTITVSGTPCNNDLGLVGPSNCNASQLLTIGGTKYTSCNGEGNVEAGSFDQVNDAGGSFLAFINTPNNTLCLNSNATLHVYTQGITSKFENVKYSLTANNGNPINGVTGFTPVTNQSLSSNLAISPILMFVKDGTYKFELTVSYGVKKNVKTQVREVTIEVGQSSIYTGTWSKGIPSLTNKRKAKISSDYITVIAGSFDACSCEVDTGKKLTISPNTYVKVQDNIVNNGNIVIQTDGNLLQVNGGPSNNTGNPITVQRQVNGLHNNLAIKMDYVFWSSPVQSQKLLSNASTPGTSFSSGTPNNRIYEYNEMTDYFVPTGDANFVPAKGYAIRAESLGNNPDTGAPFAYPYNRLYAFSGKPNNGDYSILIKRSPDNPVGTVHGYNVVGNPYPSNIKFDELYKANSTLIYGKAWFWTNRTYTQTQGGSSYDGSNYVIYTMTGTSDPASPDPQSPLFGYVPPGTNGIIKVGQGFMVQVKPGQIGNLNFKNFYGTDRDKNNLRVADSGTFYTKNSGKNRFWLQLTSPNKIVNNQLIGYIEGASDAYDPDFDAEAMSLTSDLFYSLLDDKRLVVQGKSSQFKVDDQVKLGANFFQNGNYIIGLQQPEGIFGNGQTIYLKDNETGIITNLTERNYKFEAKAGETDGRFEIIYRPGTILIADSKVKESVVVYRDSNDFVVQSPKTIASVEVYDLSGKLITILNANSKQAVLNSSSLQKGMYVLRIKTTDGAVTNKKIVK